MARFEATSQALREAEERLQWSVSSEEGHERYARMAEADALLTTSSLQSRLESDDALVARLDPRGKVRIGFGLGEQDAEHFP